MLIQAFELLDLKRLQSVEVTVKSIDKRLTLDAELLGILTGTFRTSSSARHRTCDNTQQSGCAEDGL